LATVLFLCLIAGCDDPEQTVVASSTSSGPGGTGGSGGSGGSPVCGSANRALDEGALVEIAFDDSMPATHLREQNFAVTTTQEYVLNEQVVHEAVRFELEHPARIHGFKVMWAALPAGMDPAAELTAGLYDDFGYNGFDFWAPEPLWTGTRCAEDIVDKEWVTYALDTPIDIVDPGLVYVAHRALPGEPVFWFDATVNVADPDLPCAVFDECQSALNLPEADANLYYNGLSFSFQYHYMVRLLVEYTDSVGATDKIFQPVAGPPPSAHVSWGDYNDDGWDDLLLGNLLYENDQNGGFIDVSTTAGTNAVPATGGVFGDYDNDGCLDLFLFVEGYNVGDSLLHNNCNGTFTAVTQSGIVDQQSYETCNDPANTASPTAAAAWFDLEPDGDLDLYLVNFICWEKETYYVDTVFRNKGDGTFEDISGQLGFATGKFASRTVAPIDHEGDGDIDVLVGNYRLQRNQMFLNNGNGTVTESAQALGLAGTPGGSYWGHTIGLAWGDLDNDGDFDNITANLAHPRFFDFSDKTQVLLNDGTGHYSDLSAGWTTPFDAASGLRYRETHSVPVLADFDNDGALDLAITAVYDGRPTDFYWGNGDGTFRLDAYHAGITTENGWGIAAADYDGDGDADVYASQLFENTMRNAGHWLSVRVVGVTSNRAAIGATVRVEAGGQSFVRQVQGGTGKGGQDSHYLHFGLGGATAVDLITVTYPGGATDAYAGPLSVDQRVWLTEGNAIPVVSWGKP
jgi:hypothetical protein